MRANKLREILNNDQPSFSTHIHSTWPSVVEAIGHTGMYDYVEFVAEYAPYDLYDLDNLCRAAELFDLGMMIEEARHAISIARPDTLTDHGQFGVGTRRHAYMGYGGGPDYVEALREIVVMLMIEKQGAVDQLEEILALDGLDMIQWGGSDYSMNIGRPGERNSDEVLAVEKHVIETSLKMGVHPRAEIGSPDEAERYLEMGVKHFSIGTDIGILFQWFKSNGEALRKVVEG